GVCQHRLLAVHAARARRRGRARRPLGGHGQEGVRAARDRARRRQRDLTTETQRHREDKKGEWTERHALVLFALSSQCLCVSVVSSLCEYPPRPSTPASPCWNWPATTRSRSSCRSRASPTRTASRRGSWCKSSCN